MQSGGEATSNRAALVDRPVESLAREYLIVSGGGLAGAGAHSHSAGNATAGSEEAARFERG